MNPPSGKGSSGAPGQQAGPSRPTVQGQTLITIVNDPRADTNKGWWGFGRQDLHSTNWQQPPPPLDPQKYPQYTRRDLGPYLKIVQSLHKDFIHERSSLAETASRQLLLGDVGPEGDEMQEAAMREVAAQGDGLAKALHKVPVMFFQEDFSVERSGLLFTADEDSLDQLMERIDTLTSYLDVVETQMAREVAVRSKAVTEAAKEVEVINQQVCGALSNIRLLRSHLEDADAHTYASTCHVLALQRRRKNVDQTLEALQSLEELHTSRTALQLLLDGQDYAGALDLLEEVSHNVEASCAQRITTFASVLPEMQETRDLLESLLACEFVGLANFDSAHVVLDSAVARICDMGPGVVPSADDMAALLGPEGGQIGATVSNGQGGYLAGQEGTVAEEEAAVAREQLHDKLLPVVLALLRVDRLSGAMQQLHENVCAATKGLVAEAMERCLGPTGPAYLQQPGGASALGMMQDSVKEGQLSEGQGQGAAGASAPGSAANVDQGMTQALQGVGHDGFMQVLFVIHAVVAAFVRHCSQLSSIIRSDILPAARAPAATVNTVTRDTLAITQGLADVAQSRWVRLLNSRGSQLSRLRLYEFQALADACESFAALLEPLSVRAAMGVRTAAQTQGRVFLDAMHARNVAQLQHLLEAEQWTPAEVPPQFQAIVDRVVQRSMAPQAPGSQGGRGHRRNLSMTDNRDASPGSALQRTNTLHTAAPRGTSWAGLSQPEGSSGPPQTGTLQLQGKSFPLVNTTIMMLKLLDEYVSLTDSSPMFTLEVGHHICDLLKVFNRESCDLVLHARAVRTAGLKSISAKHLALSCASCYMLARLLPCLRTVLLTSHGALQAHSHTSTGVGNSLEARRRMLVMDFDKIGGDLGKHTSDIHSKLIDIMQERLVLAARQMTQESVKWGNPGDVPPSSSLAGLQRSLGTLQGVLGPILQQEEVQFIFGRVASVYSEALAMTLDSLQHPKLAPPPAQATSPQPNNPLARGLGMRASGSNLSASVIVDPKELAAWEDSRKRNAEFALQMLQRLPVDPAQAPTYLSRLSTFLTKHYGAGVPNGRQAVPTTLPPPGPSAPATPPPATLHATASAVTLGSVQSTPSALPSPTMSQSNHQGTPMSDLEQPPTADTTAATGSMTQPQASGSGAGSEWQTPLRHLDVTSGRGSESGELDSPFTSPHAQGAAADSTLQGAGPLHGQLSGGNQQQQQQQQQGAGSEQDLPTDTPPVQQSQDAVEEEDQGADPLSACEAMDQRMAQTASEPAQLAAQSGEEPEQATDTAQLAEQPEQATDTAQVAVEPEQASGTAQPAEEPEQDTDTAQPAEDPEQTSETAQVAVEPEQDTDAAQPAEEPEQDTDTAQVAVESEQATDTAQPAEEPAQDTDTAQVAEDPEQTSDTAQVAVESEQATDTAQPAEEPEQDTDTAQVAEKPEQDADTAQVAVEPEQDTDTAQPAMESEQTSDTAQVAVESEQATDTAQPAEEPEQDTDTAQVAEKPEQDADTAQVAVEPEQDTDTAQPAEEPEQDTGTAQVAVESEQASGTAQPAEEPEQDTGTAQPAEEPEQDTDTAQVAEDPEQTSDTAQVAVEPEQDTDTAQPAEEPEQASDTAQPAEKPDQTSGTAQVAEEPEQDTDTAQVAVEPEQDTDTAQPEEDTDRAQPVLEPSINDTQSLTPEAAPDVSADLLGLEETAAAVQSAEAEDSVSGQHDVDATEGTADAAAMEALAGLSVPGPNTLDYQHENGHLATEPQQIIADDAATVPVPLVGVVAPVARVKPQQQESTRGNVGEGSVSELAALDSTTVLSTLLPDEGREEAAEVLGSQLGFTEDRAQVAEDAGQGATGTSTADDTTAAPQSEEAEEEACIHPLA